MKAEKDISGLRFGRLVAEEFLYFDENGRDCWRFQCDCGNEKVMPAANVKWGRVRSCGCLAVEHGRSLNKQDITGKRYGRLTAVRPTEKRDKSGSIVWECRCDCGKVVLHSVNALNNGRTQSCGCLYRESRETCGLHRKDLVENTVVSQLVASKGIRTDNTSGCTGVYYNKQTQKWMAYINFQKKRYHLGSYAEKEKAIQARKIGEQKLHDPVILDNLSCLNEVAKKDFMNYLAKERE